MLLMIHKRLSTLGVLGYGGRIFVMWRSRLPAPRKESPPDFVLISYPGIVKNIDKAMETLGGLAAVNQLLNTFQSYYSNRALELRHTADNPYTSCMVADRKNETKVTSGTVHIAIKVRRKKRNPSVMEATSVGMIGTIFQFENLCDFQYLPLRGQIDSDIFIDLMPKLIPQDLPSALCWWDKPDQDGDETPLFLPPFQFSRYSTPSLRILGRDTTFGEKSKKRGVGHGQNLRVERKVLSINVHSNDEFPSEPTEEAVNDANFRCKNEEPHRLMKELFEQRPMWTRVAVSFKTGLDEHLLKCLLQKFAFYIANGPWGRLWCRFGYDPRKDSKAVEYQTLMVTFRQHQKIPERQRLKVATTIRQNQGELDDGEIVHYAYTPGRLPKVRQMWYSLCDIDFPAAQTLIRQSSSEEYNPNHGYVNGGLLDSLREMIKQDVLQTSKELDVDEADLTYESIDEWQ